MKKVIKHPKKMKNAMYIVFGAFALALFAITRIHPSYANEGLMIDDALDAIVLYGEVEQLPEDDEEVEVQDEENQEIEENEDIVEPEENIDEEINEKDETSEDLDEIGLERDNKEIDKTENKEENHVVSDENSDNEKGQEVQNLVKEGNNLSLTLETTVNTLENHVEMNEQLQSINFKWNEIVIPDPDNVYSGIIIMDRNLGATIPGTGEGSYGYFYQWGNNYGFADTGEVESTTELATWNDSYSHSGYYGNRFINTNNSFYWSDNNSHSDSWGGEGDAYENYRGYNIINKTAENRQGPCPDGWHVPSMGEWSKLVNFWFDYNHKNGYNESPRLYRYSGNYGLSHLEDTASMLIVNDLLIPWAGMRYNSSNSSYQNQKYGYGYYYSSTPSIYLYISYNNFCPDQSLSKHTYGYSVRCFKNTYDPDIYTVTFNTNGGHNYESKEIAGGTKLMLYADPIKFGSTFEGWYKDEALTEPFDFNTPVTQSFTLYAKWKDGFGTISISDPENPLSGFTIMDRNLGAKNAGTGEDAFGYYYQRGNNHGFSTTKSYTTTLAEWNDDYIHQGYYGTQFVSTNISSYWSDNQVHDSLRGGENDNYNNNYGFDIANETAENRQGPCPNGYHIPSIGERKKLVEYRKKSYYYDNNVILDFNNDKDKKKALNFIEYFELPLQNNYEPASDSNGNRNMRLYISSPAYGYYRASSVSGNLPYLLSVYNKGIYPDNVYNNYRGHNIRCFSNEYVVPEEKYKLTLYTNSGGYVDMREIAGNHKLTGLPNFTREHSVLEGWYEDENFTKMDYDFNEFVDSDLTFYAKWSCDFGYQMSDDGQSCEPISVKFNANGGKFTNNENILIKSSYLKEVSPEITEIIHTSNVLDDGTQNGVYGANNRVDVVTIPGAKKLHIILKWGFEGSSGEGMRVWSGSHSDYTPESHSDTAIKFDDGVTWLWGVNLKTEDFEIDGDSVTFGIKTDAYTYWGIQYGYHATVTKDAEYVVDYEDGLFDPIEEPTREGYEFKGWYFDNETFQHEFDKSEVITGESMNLYAKWQANTYTVSFDTNGGNEISPISVDCDTLFSGINLSIPTKECNEFLGWENLPETMPAHDITLKAVWDYTCSKSSGGGGAKKTETTTRETAVETPTENEHNSADEQKSDTPETSNTPANEETTSNQVISVTQEVSEDGTIEAVVETIKIKNTDIVATVRTEVASSTTSNSSSVNHTREENDAYSFAKSNGITTTSSIDDAKMNTELTRIQMAKMLSNFAINVLGQEPDPEKGIVKFDDVTNKMDKQYDNAVTKAYQLGIMGQNVKNNEFRPNDTVTRAEFASALSRLLYHTEEGNYKGTGKYYIPHVAKLYNEGIINKADPKIKEKRGYVMLMLMRTVQ